MTSRSPAARPAAFALTLAMAAALAACTVAPVRTERVAQAPVYQPVPVASETGQVRDIRYIQLAARNTGGGAVLGAVIGAVIGHQVGGGSGRAVATGVGAIGGAVIGNTIENRPRRDDEAYRVSVRFDNGSVREYDFQRIDDLRVGDT